MSSAQKSHVATGYHIYWTTHKTYTHKINKTPPEHLHHRRKFCCTQWACNNGNQCIKDILAKKKKILAREDMNNKQLCSALFKDLEMLRYNYIL